MKERKLNRKKDFNYSTDGYYFVTTVTKDRKNWFGLILNNEMILNEYGTIVQNQWIWLHKQYKYIKLDEFIIMPNHFHAIVNIDSRDDSRDDSHVETGRDLSLHGIKIKSISGLMGAFKTTSSKLIHKIGGTEFGWQRSFHDRIIRNQKEYIQIKNYIINNPLNSGPDNIIKS